jgi:hypothetical protein
MQKNLGVAHTVHLPETFYNVTMDLTVFHHGAEHLFKRCKLGNCGIECEPARLVDG